MVVWTVSRTFIGPRKKNHKILLRIHIPCISCEPSLNWSLVLDKLRMEFTEMTQLGSFFNFADKTGRAVGSRLNLYES